MAPNHGGDPLGSILEPIGSHLVKKMGQNRKKLPCPKIRIFEYRGHRFFTKNGSYGYGAKSWLGLPRVNLGANGVPLGPKKWVKTVKKLPCPKIRTFDYPAVITFYQIMEVTLIAPNHGGNPLGSILGPMGSHGVHKMGQNRKKLRWPNIRIFDYPANIVFSQKMEVTVMAPNHGGEPLGSILGPMGSHWVKKMGQNRKKLPCPKIRIFDFPVINFFAKNGSYGYGTKSRWGPPRIHLGANGVRLGQKMGQNRKRLPCPKIRIFNYPAVIHFSKKNGSYGYGAKSRWGPSGVHLGANGVPLGSQNGSKL